MAAKTNLSSLISICSLASAPQLTSLHAVAVNEPRIETIRKVEIRSSSTAQPSPEITLTLISRQRNMTSAAGVLTIYASINENITLSYQVTKMKTPGNVPIFYNGKKSKRVQVNKTELLIKIVHLKESDTGTYLVKAKRNNDTATTTFTLVIEGEPVSRSTSVSTRPSTSPTRNSVNLTRDSTQIITRDSTQITSKTTSTRPSGSLNSKIHTEGEQTQEALPLELISDKQLCIQGWFIFVIIFCILLVIIIPAVYCSYKHRQSLRRRCCYLAPKSGKYNEMTATELPSPLPMHMCIVCAFLYTYYERTGTLLI